MNIPSTILLIATALGILYVLLAFVVLGHIEEEKKSLLAGRWLVFFFWWPFYGDMYKKSALRLCLVGRALFVVIYAMYIWWFIEVRREE